MGGYFSTRWGAERIRQDTGGLLSLDIASLRRLGALTPGVLASVQWTDGRGDDAGSIMTRMHPAGDALTLIYSIREGEGDWQPVRERIKLDATPCTYGGERLWLTCPSCDSRRRVLYSLGGRFRCRRCHDLAYSSTREDVVERSQRRTLKLHKRLGAPSSAGIFDLPPRPRGMHWETYERIANQLISERRLQLRTLIAKREQLEASIAKHLD
jgi:hypothetical protein